MTQVRRRREVGLFTPETTMARATRLNNAFYMLWQGATGRQREGPLRAVSEGYQAYFQELRNNFAARFTEWGELEKWEKQYAAIRKRIAAGGGDVRKAPVIVPIEPPGASFGAGVGSGIGVALVGLAALFVFTRTRRR